MEASSLTIDSNKHWVPSSNEKEGYVCRAAEKSKRLHLEVFRIEKDAQMHGQHVKEMQGGTHMNVCAGSQHLRNIHVPKTITSAPFLQHPALSAGQKRYLCSIASVYSTEHMRQQVKRHYLNMLRTCLHSGQKPTSRRRCQDHQHQQRGDKSLTKGAVMDVTRATTLGQRKSSSNSATVNSEVILPKIVNR